MAESHIHSNKDFVVLVGYSIGGDAANQSGKPQGGTKWDAKVVTGARVDGDFLNSLAASARNSNMVVVVSIKGDKKLANDGSVASAVAGRFFGDRSYEGLIDKINKEYGSVKSFTDGYSNVSIVGADRIPHAGAGNSSQLSTAVHTSFQSLLNGGFSFDR
ncbi:MAG: hypothetical protein ACRBBQ_17355 [Cognatishimia sp.]